MKQCSMSDQIKPYLILDDNKDVIIPLDWVENTFSSKTAQIIKPLGDTRSILNISMKWNYYQYLRVDLELQSDYHEINYDDNDELKSLFKSWEREVKLNQLGI